MIKISADRRRAMCRNWDELTTGSVGYPVHFDFSDDWEGLGKVAVFRGSGQEVDVILTGSDCCVPPEVLTEAGGTLSVGVYGTDGETVVIPTVFTEAGTIRHGAEPSEIDPLALTPSLVDQILMAVTAAQEAAEEAADVAGSLRDDADNGAFDGATGFSPLVLFENVPGGYLLKITDILGEHSRVIYNGVNGDDGVSPEVTITEINGGHRVTITDAEHPNGQTFDILDGSGGSVTVDDEISGSSTNPVQNKVVKAALDAKGTYSKPSGGIPKTDLASDVQTSLGKADSALQQHQDISGKLNANQGVANAGKFLVVGNDGVVTPVTMAVWQGGSY